MKKKRGRGWLMQRWRRPPQVFVGWRVATPSFSEVAYEPPRMKPRGGRTATQEPSVARGPPPAYKVAASHLRPPPPFFPFLFFFCFFYYYFCLILRVFYVNFNFKLGYLSLFMNLTNGMRVTV